MGVGFITCKRCEYNFPDCGDFVRCDCGISFCSYECSELKFEDEDEDKHSCCICRNEFVLDSDLLNFVLNYYGITREQAEKMYKK